MKTLKIQLEDSEYKLLCRMAREGGELPAKIARDVVVGTVALYTICDVLTGRKSDGESNVSKVRRGSKEPLG